MSTSQPGILPQVFIETQAGSNWKRQVWAGTSLAATETHAYSPVSIIPGERHCDATHGGRGGGGPCWQILREPASAPGRWLQV